MRKLILFNLATLDGYFAGPQGEIDWHRVDAEFNDFAIAQLETAGGLVFGRITYELMAGYWPTAEALADDPIVAGKMNAIPKFVFSRTLGRADWQNTTLIRGDALTETAQLKARPGKDLFIFGSADLASAFTGAGLIDEYRIILNPVILGRGLPLFPHLDNPVNLRLLNIKTFHNGNVLLYYEKAPSAPHA